MDRSPHHSRWPARAALMMAALLAPTRAVPVEPLGRPDWPTGRPAAIAVRDGRATFDLPAVGPDARTLLVVSALARDGGPFPIRVVARPSAGTRPPSLIRVDPPPQPPRPESPPAPPPPPVDSRPPGERSFSLMVGEGDVAASSGYRKVVGRLRAVGRRVQIYVDRDNVDEVGPATLRDLVSTFDESIFPVAAARFGPARDVDGDGRFTILMTGWLARLSGGKVSVDGFVRGADLDPGLMTPFGNRCDMMYLNTRLEAGPHLRTVVAHEYTHAVTFSRKALDRGPGGSEEEGWLDEALAHLVEDAFGFSRSNIDYRVSAFLSRPERYRLVVDDYYAANLFRGHGNRGATYLFLRWCVDQYGPGLLDSLVRSGRRGVDNLESATGSTFADLFRRWSVSLYLDQHAARDPGDGWTLAGPRASTIHVGGPVDAWSAEGTSAHFAVVEGMGTIEIEGPPNADLQVTAVPLPTDLGRFDLAVRPSTGPDGTITARAKLIGRDGPTIRLEALAWEPLVPASDPHAPGFRRDRIEGGGIASAFGSATLSPRAVLDSRPIRLEGVRPHGGPIVFKAVGVDPKGRRVSAWAVFEPSAMGERIAGDSPKGHKIRN